MEKISRSDFLPLSCLKDLNTDIWNIWYVYIVKALLLFD